VFVALSYLQPSLKFEDKAVASTPVGPLTVLHSNGRLGKYETRAEVTDSDKHSSLFHYRVNYNLNMLVAYTVKLFTLVVLHLFVII
jgi:hypothetical protein